MEISDEIKALFELARTTFGAPIRKVELEDENLCSALERALLLYNEYVLNFVIENKWSNFYNKTKLSNSELAFAFSTNTLDLSRDYSDYFSHLVGLQQHGTKWELKKDYFKIIPGQQVYTIPAGRAINKVLRFSVNTSDPAVMATLFGGYGYGSPMFQMGAGAAAMWAGTGFGYFMPFYSTSVFDVALASSHMKDINSFLGAQIAHKVTAGPDGTHLVHLMNVPGGFFDKMGGFGKLPECFCWYTYYDVPAGEDGLGECASENPDVYLSPDEIKLNMKNYGVLNDAAKAVVTRIFIANAAQTLAFIRGKFSGNINMINGSLTMDYAQLMDYGNREKESALTDLKERLQRMSPYEMMKRENQLVQDTIGARKGTPLKIYVR